MAAKSASTTKFDSKAGATGKKNYVKVTIVVETVKGRYNSKAATASDLGNTFDDYLSDIGYDDNGYGRYRIQAETLTEDEFSAKYDA